MPKSRKKSSDEELEKDSVQVLRRHLPWIASGVVILGFIGNGLLFLGNISLIQDDVEALQKNVEVINGRITSHEGRQGHREVLVHVADMEKTLGDKIVELSRTIAIVNNRVDNIIFNRSDNRGTIR